MSPTLCDGPLDNDRTLQLAMELQQLMCLEDNMMTGLPDELNTFSYLQTMDDGRNRRSQNMTECVPVPSSEHVAEIVGRQGCKIKALRAKTNTYIKTPVRGEEPVFVVTGRKEDVAKAKKEILSAAEHFSQIRASRKNGMMGMSPPGPPMKVPGQVTIQVRVPYRVVGLVVGPKGATIKRIQQNTHTYIVTPSRDKDPVFEVTGMADQVEHARQEIEAHIALRTGSVTGSGFAELMQNGMMEDSPDLLNALYKTGIGSLLNFLEPNQTYPMAQDTLGMLSSVSASTSSGAFSSSGSISSSSSSSGSRLADLGSIWSSSLDRDEGLGDSPSLEGNIWSFPSTRPSPAASASPTESLGNKCALCVEREANVGLIPCGHNNFCYECTSRMLDGSNPVCPRCNRMFTQILRLQS